MEPETGGVRQPRRVVVASYESYPEAQRAVDHLSDERFPVERVAIVAEDLRLVEQVTGRMGYGRAALQGAGLGAMIGFVLGLFFGLFSFYVAILWLIYGAIVGAIMSLVGHSLSGGQRDFSSIEGIQAGRYNVMTDEEVADEASQLLAELQPPSGEARRETMPEPPPRAGEEAAASPGREESPPETRRMGEAPPREEPVTREGPLSEERPQRPEATPPTDASQEAPPSSREQPRRPPEEPPRGVS
jgi:hypothetical protein